MLFVDDLVALVCSIYFELRVTVSTGITVCGDATQGNKSTSTPQNCPFSQRLP